MTARTNGSSVEHRSGEAARSTVGALALDRVLLVARGVMREGRYSRPAVRWHESLQEAAGDLRALIAEHQPHSAALLARIERTAVELGWRLGTNRTTSEPLKEIA